MLLARQKKNATFKNCILSNFSIRICKVSLFIDFFTGLKALSPAQMGTCHHVCILGCACHVSGSEISLKSHIFGSRICKHELPIFGGRGGGKTFQQLPFSLSSIM